MTEAGPPASTPTTTPTYVQLQLELVGGEGGIPGSRGGRLGSGACRSLRLRLGLRRPARHDKVALEECRHACDQS